MLLVGVEWTRASDALLNTPTIQVLQYMMLAAGAAASAYAAYRIAMQPGRSQALRSLWPHLVLLAILVAVNVYMFPQPMAHRT